MNLTQFLAFLGFMKTTTVDESITNVDVSDAFEFLNNDKVTKETGKSLVLDTESAKLPYLEFIDSNNLFDKTKATEGFYINENNGNLIANSAWWASEYIDVEQNTEYIATEGDGCFFALYDINKNYISGGLLYNPAIFLGAVTTINTTSNTYFIRVSTSVFTNNLNFQFVKGNILPEYKNSKIIPTYLLENVSDDLSITIVEKKVKAGGTIGVDCDFTDIKSCLDSITDNSKYKQYNVTITNGVYDISNDPIPFLGFKNYVNIIGQSLAVQIINRKPTFSSTYACFDIAFYTENIEYASIKNCTLISYNGKAPIHIDDNYSKLKGTIEIENCICINENESNILHYQVGVACGLFAEQNVICKNVQSNGILYVHNNSNGSNKGFRFELHNCQFPWTQFLDVFTYDQNIVILKNCITKYIELQSWNVFGLYNGTDQHSIQYLLEGNQIDYIVGKYVGEADENQGFWNRNFGGKFGVTDSTIHNFCKNNTATTIPRNTLVAIDSQIIENSVKPYTNGDVLYGITLDEIEPQGYGIIQYSGAILIDASGTINVGDKIQLNSSGIAEPFSGGYLIGVSQTAITGTGKIRVKLF